MADEVLCLCAKFKLWYTAYSIRHGATDVCECGHPKSEHLNSKGSCIGVSEVSKG